MGVVFHCCIKVADEENTYCAPIDLRDDKYLTPFQPCTALKDS